jgi:hypothetical protein
MAVNDPNKFRQIYNLENQILVEADYDNIIIIDPNKVVDNQKQVKDRFVQQENFVMYANLETKIIPRTKLAIGESFDSPVNNTTIASLGSGDDDLNINFLKPKGKQYFDTSWSDEFTGRGTRQGRGTNQNAQYETKQDGGGSTFKSKVLNFEDTQTLGIESIRVKISSIGTPTVDIELTDIRGRALFEQGENSLYSVFFNLPYPTFYLVLKGYYGKAIRYQLTLLSFNAKFSPESGNFNISLKLMGRNSAILADSLISFAKHSPKMFRTEVTTNKKTSTSSSSSSNSTTKNVTNDTVGLQKLREVYKIYESKGLIKDLPVTTMEDFIIKCNSFDKNVQDKIKGGDFDVINDVADYRKNLDDLKQRVFFNSISDFLDTSEKLYIDGKIYYPYLESFNLENRNKKREAVKSDFDVLVKRLNENTSFGKGGKYKLPGKAKEQSGEITNKLNFDEIITNSIDYNGISNENFKKTYELNYGSAPSDEELEKFIIDFKTLNKTKQIIIDSKGNQVQSNPTLWFFGDKVSNTSEYFPDSFLDKINKMTLDVENKRKVIEQALTDELKNILVDSKSGLGFTPTIRNVFAVLFGGLDAFYRMMEDTHTNAWKQRKNPIRLDVILPPGKNVGVDTVEVVNGTAELNKENTVYPWPQYYELERQNDGSEQYTIKYPGDALSVAATKGFNQVIWPEIAFTEEYIAASLEKESPQTPQVTGNEKKDTDYVSVSAIEFPFKTLPYQDISEVSFLYEIFERSYLSTHYSKINRGNYKTDQIDKFLSDIEGENIKTSITSNLSPVLNNILKNSKPIFTEYLKNLKEISSKGTGPSWVNYSNSNYNLNYIKNYIDSGYNKIYSIDTLNGTSIAIAGNIPFKDKIKDYINNTKSSEEFFLDPYPLNDINWLKNNLQDGQSLTTVNDFFNTKSLLFLDDKKTIARLGENETITNVNLFVDKYGFENYTSTNYLLDQQNQVTVNSRDSLKNYFLNKKNEYLYLTESFIEYGNNYSGNVGTNIQTTSLLNTPYFINAILDGVEKSKNPNEKTPYTSLGYLFLNSLPLITTKEKIKQTSSNNAAPTDLDYLAATFNKFSAIHKLPYAWVLKYGSIWHRYKKYIEGSGDILDSVWKDFDYLGNYDPINSAATTSYSGTWVGNITLQQSTLVPNLTNVTLDTITTGFYPKVINNLYRFFYNNDLSILQTPTYNNFVSITNNFGFKAVNSYSRFFDVGFDTQSPNRQFTIKNYHQYFEKPNGDDTKILVIPSMGSIGFNQSEFECFNSNDKKTEEMFNNKSVYNGSVRSLWSAPNFGYFDNSLIKKPKYNEYIKKIDTTQNKKQSAFNLKNNQDTYSSIEEIFALFEPSILDEFENRFLAFCNPNPNASDLKLLEEQTNSTQTTSGQVPNIEQKRLFNQIESLFLIPKNSIDLSGDDSSDAKNISNAQLNNFATSLIKFLNFDCILKLGNPSNFERKSFNYFTDNQQFKPIAGVKPSGYVKGSLPGDSLNTTLINSQIANKTEWETLKKYVGEFTQSGIDYQNSGSSITDFFIENNIGFTQTNIETLYPLIRLYAKEKLKDNTFNGPKFIQKINTFMVEQRSFNSDVLDGTIRYLNKNLDETKVKTNTINSSLSGNIVKLEYYTTLKTLNDKWIAGTDFTNKTIFEDFLFLDRANRDIGDEFTIDVSEMATLLSNPNKNYLDLISGILEKNYFIFFAMPAYFNFYGLQDAVSSGKPIPVDIPNSLFGTYLDVDYIDSRPKFLCVYVGKPSEYPASDASYVRFKDDAFDLRKYDNPLRKEDKDGTDFSKKNKVVGFAVDYGIQNQSIFKGVDLDMSEKKNTAESNRLVSQIGQSASGDKVAQQTVSLYSIYKARSYTATVKSVGNAMIQPTMYFNLRHIPLFYGPYWIMSVEHSVRPGNFDTTFKGVRMPIYSLPKPNSMIEAVNKNYTEYYKDLIVKSKKVNESTNEKNLSDENANKNEETGPVIGEENSCKNAIPEQYNTLELVDLNLTNITQSEIKDKINNLTTGAILKPLYYGIVTTKYFNKKQGVMISTPNNNLYGINALTLYNKTLTDNYSLKIVCLGSNNQRTYPYFAFQKIDDSLNFYNEIVKPFEPILEEIKNRSTKTEVSEKYAEAFTMFTLFWDQSRFVKEGGGVGYYNQPPKSADDFITRYNEKVKPEDGALFSTANAYLITYNNYYKLFFN